MKRFLWALLLIVVVASLVPVAAAAVPAAGGSPRWATVQFVEGAIEAFNQAVVQPIAAAVGQLQGDVADLDERVTALENSSGVSACFDQEVYPPGTGDQACQQADAYCVLAWAGGCGNYASTLVPCRGYPAGGGFCARCCR